VFVETVAKKTAKTAGEVIGMIGITPAKHHDWRGRAGRPNRHNGRIPKAHWLFEWERAKIVAYARANPGDGYRLLSYKMLDEGAVAASPASVYRTLKEHALLGRWNKNGTSARGGGFEQPSRAHEHWHVDIKYVNFKGTFLFLISVIDGWSRYIVHHELRERMETFDVEITVQKALEHFPEARPRIISDNGSQFLSREFGGFLRESGLSHVRTSVNYPQANGKIERWHRSLSEECLRRTALIDLDDAREQIAAYVSRYNESRPHSALHYLTPADFLFGRVGDKLKIREERLNQARSARISSRNQASGFTISAN